MFPHDATPSLAVAAQAPVAETARSMNASTRPPTPAVPGWRRALGWGGTAASETFWLLVIVFCLPLGVLAIGLPIAAVVRLGLWLLGWS